MAERLIDEILYDRAKEGLERAGYEVEKVARLHPPQEVGGEIEAWFVTKDGTGDYAYMIEVRDGAKILLEVVPDP